MILRPARDSDLDDLVALAHQAGVGMTNFPPDAEVLAAKIHQSTLSFGSPPHQPEGELYILVLEEPVAGRVVGVAAIIASVGLERPFYSFKILTLINSSRELDRYDPVQVLQMVCEYQGASEIGMLYLHPDHRRDGNGRFLSRGRFLYMAHQPQRFGDPVIAEMRGVVDRAGCSPFWDAVGSHFFAMEFHRADFLSAQGHHQFIADLMPKHPIYLRLLPLDAQAVVGQPHEHTRPALKLLEREGFRFGGCVDVFDAGPTLQCPLANVATARDSRLTVLEDLLDEDPLGELTSEETYFIARPGDEFRIGRGRLRWLDRDHVAVDGQLARRLGAVVGESLRVAPF